MYPHQWRPLREDEKIGFCANHPESMYNKQLKVVGDDDQLVMPPGFVERGIHLQLYNMEVRKDDIWIITYPKCGTTWTSVRRTSSTRKKVVHTKKPFPSGLQNRIVNFSLFLKLASFSATTLLVISS